MNQYWGKDKKSAMVLLIMLALSLLNGWGAVRATDQNESAEELQSTNTEVNTDGATIFNGVPEVSEPMTTEDIGEYQGETFNEVRLYQGRKQDFLLDTIISNQVNAANNNQSITEVMEAAKGLMSDAADYEIEDKLLEQIKIFAANREEWAYQDYAPFTANYSVYDMDHDGILELITNVVAGSGIFSENHFYQADLKEKKLIELQQSNANTNEWELGTTEQTIFKDSITQKIYYTASDVNRNGIQSVSITDGVYWLENGHVYSQKIRGKLTEDDSITFFDTNDREISESEWNSLYDKFVQSKSQLNKKMNWMHLTLEELEELTSSQLIHMLVKTYSS